MFHSPTSQTADGFRIPATFSSKIFRSSLTYKARPDDIFIVTYPKCGTTWTQNILALVFNQGQPIESQIQFLSDSPFLEMAGLKAAEVMTRPGSIKTHFPFHMVPWSEESKYIYVSRNPKDTCVSFYYHEKIFQGFNESFNQFFEMFLSGTIDYGDYFDHLMGWYEHRNDPNVLIMTFEEMKEDTAASILKMASFIDDKKYAEPLRRDPEKLNKVLKYSSFDHMKEVVNKGYHEIFTMSKEELMKSGLPDGWKENLSPLFEKRESTGTKNVPASIDFVRKGIVGDWKNHFTEEQSKRMDEKFSERTEGAELSNLWKHCM